MVLQGVKTVLLNVPIFVESDPECQISQEHLLHYPDSQLFENSNFQIFIVYLFFEIFFLFGVPYLIIPYISRSFWHVSLILFCLLLGRDVSRAFVFILVKIQSARLLLIRFLLRYSLLSALWALTTFLTILHFLFRQCYLSLFFFQYIL